MSRRRKKEDHVNHEAWAIPYGDLVTLLLAFFVVMYAISSVNEGKYRVLSDSLVAAFRAPPKSLEPIQVGQLARAFDAPSVQTPRTLVPLETDILPDLPFDLQRDDRLPEEVLRQSRFPDEELEHAREQMRELASRIEAAIQPMIDADLIKITRHPLWIEVEINTELLFASGSADMDASAEDIMRTLGGVLAGADTEIRVEGHTDSLPIRTRAFPSNWELSSARAASVVHLFMRHGVSPEHMAAIGYGEHRPVADNASAEGRAANRRVVIVVMAGSPPRAVTEPLRTAEAIRDGAATGD